MVPDDAQRDRAGEEPVPASSRTEPAAPACATGDVTLILSQIEQGEPQAAEQLLPLVHLCPCQIPDTKTAVHRERTLSGEHAPRLVAALRRWP